VRIGLVPGDGALTVLAELTGLMVDGLLLCGLTSPARAEVERGCVALADGVAEYREGSRIRVRLRTRPSDRRLEANIDGALHGLERDGSREKAVAAVAAIFRA
jgi:hypothetical protein